MEHAWQFMVESGDNRHLVAVCGTCGIIRTSLIPNRTVERHIWLGGDCPGKPEPQEPAGGAVKRTDLVAEKPPVIG